VSVLAAPAVAPDLRRGGTPHILEVDDLGAAGLAEVLALSADPAPPPALLNRGVALLFEKPSLRTRNSAEMAVFQLGGHPITIRPDEVGLDAREAVEDVARALAGYHCVIGARVSSHRTLERMAAALDEAGMPVSVMNLLSDLAHPCQAIADLLTIHQLLGGIAGVEVAYVGDANNVLRSLSRACALSGARLRAGCPVDYAPSREDVDAVRALGGEMSVTESPREAVAGADVVYTDAWTSMGQEAEAEERRRAFAGFTVDERLVSLASRRAIVMHCLPAHRGEEISGPVLDGPRSAVWHQAANRMAAARGILAWLVGRSGGGKE
jgi:ornithine carbamoyltransferase